MRSTNFRREQEQEAPSQSDAPQPVTLVRRRRWFDRVSWQSPLGRLNPAWNTCLEEARSLRKFGIEGLADVYLLNGRWLL